MQNKLKPFHTGYKLKCPYIYGHSCIYATLSSMFQIFIAETLDPHAIINFTSQNLLCIFLKSLKHSGDIL